MNLIKYEIITAVGSSSVTRPQGATDLFIEAISGGGSGGAVEASDGDNLVTSSGGGGGGRSKKWIDSPPASLTAIVGAGASGPAAGANDGTDGGDTLVLNGTTILCLATGGQHGSTTTKGYNTWVHGGAGGNSYASSTYGTPVGDEITAGQPGGFGITSSDGNSSYMGASPPAHFQLRLSGGGGASADGAGGGRYSVSADDPGHGGGFPGGGGGGAMTGYGNGARAGGPGGNGLLRLWWYGA